MADQFLIDLKSSIQIQTKLVRLLSLTQNEARIYCAMYDSDSFTAGELSHATDIHRSRIYDNLRGLEAKKLIMQKSMDPFRFSVVSPKDSFTLIIDALKIEHRTRIQEIMTLGLKLELIYNRRTGSEMASDIRIIGLADSIHELNRLLESARERVWVSKHTSGGIVDWFVLKAHLNQLVQSGADVRFLTDRSVGAGYNTRILPAISLSYAIIDCVSITFFISNDTEKESQLMMSNNQEYLSFLEQVFLDNWDQGEVDSENK